MPTCAPLLPEHTYSIVASLGGSTSSRVVPVAGSLTVFTSGSMVRQNEQHLLKAAQGASGNYSLLCCIAQAFLATASAADCQSLPGFANRCMQPKTTVKLR